MNSESSSLATMSVESEDWLNYSLKALDQDGYILIQHVFDTDFCKAAAGSMQRVKEKQFNELKAKQLTDLKEPPFVMLMMLFDSIFFEIIENRNLVELVENYLGSDAILRNQMGQFVSPIEQEHAGRLLFHNYHRQFRYIENRCRLTLEMGILLDDLHEENGAICVVPGSHKYTEIPDSSLLKEYEVLMTGKAGSVFVLDGMTWHREMDNVTEHEFPLLLQQFSIPIIKQYFDFPRAIGEELLASLKPHTQKLLGVTSQPPASLDEYFKPVERSLYHQSSSKWIVPVNN